MFAFIKGVLVNSHANFVVIETHGVGYRIFIPCHTISHLPALGEIVLLHTSFIVRELSQSLYGFCSPQERDLFEALLEVSGIGPKLALSFIGHMKLEELQHAIIQEDIRTLCKIPGIGKKTAERLLIELKDKISHLIPSDFTSLFIPIPVDPRAQIIRDAMSALINLGYTQSIAQKAIKKTMQEIEENESYELSFLITNALKNV